MPGLLVMVEVLFSAATHAVIRDIIPTGTIPQCTLNKPNFSSRTADSDWVSPGKRRREHRRNHADTVFGLDPEGGVASLCASVNRFISPRFRFLLAILCFRSR